MKNAAARDGGGYASTGSRDDITLPGMRDKKHSNPYMSLGYVLSICGHLLLLGGMGLACVMHKPEPEELIIPVALLEAAPAGPAVQGPAEPEPPAPTNAPEPEPEPDPEPPAPPPEPEPAPAPIVEPPKPEPAKTVPEKPRVENPKVEKPKTPSLEERLKSAPSTKKDKQNPQKPRDSRQDTAKRIQDRLSRSAPTGTVSRPAGGNPNAGLTGTQLGAYDTYLVAHVQTALQTYWDRLGPEHLSSQPRPVCITLNISEDGRILSAAIANPSDSAQMNDCARKLLDAVLGLKLPPFSQAGLSVKNALQFRVNLDYRRETGR